MGLTHRYPVTKVKKLAHFISRNAASKVTSKQRAVMGLPFLFSPLCYNVQTLGLFLSVAAVVLGHTLKARILRTFQTCV